MAARGGMSDSYVGGIISSSLIPQDVDPFYVTIQQPDVDENNATDDVLTSVLLSEKASAWNLDRNRTDEDKIVHQTCTDEEKKTTINKTDEYNVDYTGLSILPWEEFVFNPRVFNDLFYAESNQRITFDPEDVNVFFHGKNVMPPTLGDISENGKSWNIEVDSINNLRKVRQWLTEKCSVFGVTLQYKEKRFSKPVNVPCLVMIDPTKDSIGDRLYTTLTRAMDSLHNQRRFCVEINLNACVERWCKRVLLTECKAIGAKLVITNGEEYANMNGTEDIVCCILCFPIWLLQTGIYKLHRNVTYDDFVINFAADDLFLHGSFQDSQYQRQHIFSDATDSGVFRTRNVQNIDKATLDQLGTYKFVSVKKIKKSDTEDVIKERKTATFEDLVDKRKEKVLKKDEKLLKRKHDKQNTPTLVAKSEKAQMAESGNSYDKNQTQGTEIRSKGEHINPGYTSDEKDVANVQETPRLPEITSLECTVEEEDSVDIEVPSEVKEDESMFSKPTDSIGGPVHFSMKKKKSVDNKSMTAVCSFEQFDEGIESDSSESEDDQEDKYNATKVLDTKDDLLGEMLKIDKSLPAIVRENRAKDVDELKAEEAVKKEAAKEGKSKQPKIKVGKVLKDLMKTTTKQSDELPSIQDSKYVETKNKLIMKKQSKKNAQIGKSTNDTKYESQNIKEQSTVEDHMTKLVEQGDLYSNKASENNEAEHDNSDLSLGSSSDGDTVEMLYESQRSMTDVTSIGHGSDTENHPKHNQQDNAKKKELSTPIDYVARANILGDNRDVKLDSVDEVKISKETSITKGGKFDDGFVNNRTESQIQDIRSTGRKVIGVQKAQSFLAVTDLDDAEEMETPITNNPTASVPPLKLNIGDKKARRGTKQYNSNRRYLGAALPNKQKKRNT